MSYMIEKPFEVNIIILSAYVWNMAFSEKHIDMFLHKLFIHVAFRHQELSFEAHWAIIS